MYTILQLKDELTNEEWIKTFRWTYISGQNGHLGTSNFGKQLLTIFLQIVNAKIQLTFVLLTIVLLEFI